MISNMISFFKYVFNFGTNELESDADKEKFLAEQITELQVEAQKIDLYDKDESEEPDNTKCFQRNGIITHCDDNFILIDGDIHYDTTNCPLKFKENDNILYLGYKNFNGSITVVRVLENQGMSWSNEFREEEQTFDVMEHVLVCQVREREGRNVFIVHSDLKFSLDDVEGTFIPIHGDWLELKCSVQKNEDRPSDISTNQVLKVISFKPLRTKIRSATITEWSGQYGTCDRQIYFNSDSIVDSVQLKMGYKVMVEAIESNQGSCSWRALKVMLVSNICTNNDVPSPTIDEEKSSLDLEQERNIEMTYPIKYENIGLNQSQTIKLNITNKSNQSYVLNKWIILGKKRDSQIQIKPFVSSPIRIDSGRTFTFMIVCNPKFFGKAKETLIFLFRGFQCKRFIEIDVVDNIHNTTTVTEMANNFKVTKKIEQMQNIRRNGTNVVAGVKLIRTPNFISIKLGQFPIPERLWSLLLDDCEKTSALDVLTKIEKALPCLTQDTNITNYIDKWHILLYLEEIDENLHMRIYDSKNVFLKKYQEYLSLDIPDLSEKRPSLIKGDRVIVKDSWNVNAIRYEGFIHIIKGNTILMKFDRSFHHSYTGSDISIEFHFTRTNYRRAHYSINLAMSSLGPDILFPSKLKIKEQQVEEENLKNIKWFNTKINNEQKNAVTNILRGECRPMPYIIFGPPGTGKTITVVETILQILTLVPESRILVATPSNSASNLITERLLQFKDSFSGSIVRIIANYLLDSDSIPEAIRPFCATIDISVENTAESKHFVKDDINLQCQKSFIGRHRVIIGTCHAVGSMKHWDLPRAHFTHVIVDEAGQATEPEIMIPLTFTDKEYGQIVLAGDPMQLGPIVMSKYCIELGMDESFLCRILERFPYQKDKNAFATGFDNRLVTKLNENYRSIAEVLTLPSDMFYDGSLIPKFEMDASELSRLKSTTYTMFELSNINDGGGIFVYGIKGSNLRSEDSPSWYNPQEASMVALSACKLYKNNVAPDEIGIITPYIAQTKYIRMLFDSMGLPQPKIGTVEDFQGQERAIILISTVRSTESFIKDDLKHTLGFIRNPKRLNVALTRAQVSVILFCNSHLLAKDAMWNKVLTYAVSKDKYMGCELPHEFINTDSQEICDEH